MELWFQQLVAAFSPFLGDSLGSFQEVLSTISAPDEPVAIKAFREVSKSAMDGTEWPWPMQGGERITEYWLFSLPWQECIWRFWWAKMFPWTCLISNYLYSISAEEVMELIQALEIPDGWTTLSHYKFTAVKVLCLLIAHFWCANDIYELTTHYDHTKSAISEIINELVIFLNNKWSHLLEFDSDGLLAPEWLERYVDAIYQAGAPIRSI